jgi:hypothetical protein
MSARRQVIIKLNDDQRNEIREKLDKGMTHIKISVVPGAVTFAEALELAEGSNG